MEEKNPWLPLDEVKAQDEFRKEVNKWILRRTHQLSKSNKGKYPYNLQPPKKKRSKKKGRHK